MQIQGSWVQILAVLIEISKNTCDLLIDHGYVYAKPIKMLIHLHYEEGRAKMEEDHLKMNNPQRCILASANF